MLIQAEICRISPFPLDCSKRMYYKGISPVVSIYIRINKPTYLRVIVPRLQVIEPRLGIIIIPSVPERIHTRHCSGCGNYIAPCVIFVCRNRCSACVVDCNNVSLKILSEHIAVKGAYRIACCAVLEAYRRTRLIINIYQQCVSELLGYEQVSVINVFVNDTIYSLAYSQARFAVRVNIFISMKVTVEGRLFHPTVSTLKDNFVTVKVLSSKKSAIEEWSCYVPASIAFGLPKSARLG